MHFGVRKHELYVMTGADLDELAGAVRSMRQSAARAAQLQQQ